ncbi:unnamed protein product [Microthlaspi erraticum]|uniref:Uncharacterized protein n=1 Tax=Microthlaspi erraticum TaxID=1685480 RepID=A0A6D2KZ29_9BRAS|nr:unnamed protein product [Microthlaspi erraticum]
MDKINGLSDDLLIKTLSFVPTKVVVSTSILSKRWDFLWMWVPKLEYDDYNDNAVANHSVSSCVRYRDFINKNLPLHKASIIDSLRFTLYFNFDLRTSNYGLEFAVSRCLRELSISSYILSVEPDVILPSSLYTCKSLVTLKLEGDNILVDAPGTVCLPSLKTLQVRRVTYMNEDSLRLLLSSCHLLEDLFIERHKDDNVKALAVTVPSLQRLFLEIDGLCSSDHRYVIATPSLKYFKVEDWRDGVSYLIKDMPKLEEADVFNDFLGSNKYVKRLSLKLIYNNEEETMYRDGIVFARLEHLKLTIRKENWSELLVRLLNDSPKLRILDLSVFNYNSKGYERINWSKELSSVPTCLLKSLETVEFKGYKGRAAERDFLRFISKNARCLKSKSSLPSSHKC